MKQHLPDTIHFASYQFLHYIIASELAKKEPNKEFKSILVKLAAHKWQEFTFWKQFAAKQQFSVSKIYLITIKLLRKTFGLTFVVKYIEHQEKQLINKYKEILPKVKDKELQKKIKESIEHEIEHEEELISQIKEERIEFISSIILGINDGLIELTGALVGFSLALQNHAIIALTGIITGIATALSMSSSAYMQAQYEPEKNAKKAAAYTGIAYIVVVICLILPFILFTTLTSSIIALLSSVMVIITAISYYTSIIFDRPFKKQISQMIIFSLGTAAITFAIGWGLRIVFSIK